MSAGRFSYKDIGGTIASSYAAIGAFSRSAHEHGLDKPLAELVKLRVSQINGCAFCVAVHLKFARALAVEQAKLDLVAVWRESPVFSPAEKAALAWAEEMARMPEARPSDAVREALADHFSHDQIIGLNIAIASISAWNRMAVAFGFSPADI
jgi:AhpD family alkylhydroperoxidase